MRRERSRDGRSGQRRDHLPPLSPSDSISMVRTYIRLPTLGVKHPQVQNQAGGGSSAGGADGEEGAGGTERDGGDESARGGEAAGNEASGEADVVGRGGEAAGDAPASGVTSDDERPGPSPGARCDPASEKNTTPSPKNVMPSAILSGIVSVNTTPTAKKVMPLAIQAPRAAADPLRSRPASPRTASSGPDSSAGCSLMPPTIRPPPAPRA